jgi:hypothetical protein
VPLDLQPGDVLLYKPKGIFGRMIALKTWHNIAHVEIYMGSGISVAARDGLGVNYYPLRTEQLVHVLRPEIPFDIEAADQYIASVLGQPYGWLDLLRFIGFNVNGKGMICSTLATNVLRAGHVAIFNDESADDVAPFQFMLSEVLSEVH